MVTAPRDAVAKQGYDPASAEFSEAGLERATTRCLQDLSTSSKIPVEVLVRVVDKNNAACEELAARAASRRSRVGSLIKQARQEGVPCEMDDGVQGLFSDLLGTLGLRAAANEAQSVAGGWAAFMPSAAFSSSTATEQVQPGPAVGVQPGADVLGVDAFLEELRHGPGRATHQAIQFLSEMEELRRRFLKLRGCWPSLRENICRAYKTGKPLQIQSVNWTLAEAMSWRRGMRSAFSNADALCSRIEDFLFRCNQEREERRQWRQKTETIVSGLDSAVAARIAGLSWLRRTAAALASSNRLEEVSESAAKTFELNLQAAELAQHRLKKCAATVMRFETEHTIVQTAVGRLSSLKTELLETADAASSAADLLLGADGLNGKRAEFLEGATNALKALMEAIDEAADALCACPLQFPKDGGAVPEISKEAEKAFCDWVRDILCKEESEEEEELSEESIE